MLGGGMISIDI